MRLRVLTLMLLVLAHAVLAACEKRERPEESIRALIGDAERAVEKKAISEVRNYLSPRYRDDEGRDRRTIERILRLYVFGHESIHLFTRIESVTLQAPDAAKAVVYVAMAGRPITSADDVSGFRANLHRFELALADEGGEWRVVRVAWRRAEPTDFIYAPTDGGGG